MKSLASNKSTLPKSARPDLFRCESLPGPGNYEVSYKKSGPSYSFSGKSNKKTVESPGPGAYDPKIISSKSGYAVAAKDQRKDFIHVQDTPGPGQYDLVNKPSIVRYSFGKSSTLPFKSETPGPGQYEPKIGGKPCTAKFGKEQKKTLVFGDDNPSAVNYSPKGLKKAPSYSFGVKCLSKFDNGVPGPGTYTEAKTERKNTDKVARSARFTKSYIEKESETKPGPGNYDHRSSLSSAKVFTATAKRELHYKSPDTPGPGQYDPKKN